MSAPAPSTLDIIVSAMRKLNVLGAGQSQPSAEDTELGLDTFNEVCEQLNLRKRNSYFRRSQSFAFGTPRQSYSIGAAAGTPDFVVSSGGRPVKIEIAQIINTGTSPNSAISCAVLTYEEYVRYVSTPALTGQFPALIGYQPTTPNGTIWPYPAFPTQAGYKLDLTWWAQFDTVALADIGTALVLSTGYRGGLAIKLAVKLWPSFAKRTDLEELKRQEREAWSDITAPNVPPTRMDTTDGIQSNGSGWDWRSRTWA